MALSCKASVVKYFLFFFNFIVWLSGVLLLSSGIWILVTHTSPIHHLNLAGGSMEKAGVALCVVGAMVFIVSGLGCWGACTENKTCLMVFAGLFSFLIIAQLITLILASVLSNTVIEVLGRVLNQAMLEEYGQYEYDNITEGWNFIQMTMGCCGTVKGPEDWERSEWWRNNRTEPEVKSVPDSCCVNITNPSDYINPKAADPSKCYKAAFNPAMKNRKDYVHVKGCQESVKHFYSSGLTTTISIASCILFIQLVVGVCTACCLSASTEESFPRSHYTNIGYV